MTRTEKIEERWKTSIRRAIFELPAFMKFQDAYCDDVKYLLSRLALLEKVAEAAKGMYDMHYGGKHIFDKAGEVVPDPKGDMERALAALEKISKEAKK